MQFQSSFEGYTHLRMIALVVLSLCVSACGIQNPVIDTLMYSLPGGRQYAELRPGIEYLVVELDGRASVMALGSRRVDGLAPFEDVTEYWYNGQGEMLALKNGRIHQAMGMAQEWRSNESKPPRWREAMPNVLQTWVRRLDRMPGYRYAGQDEITTGLIDSPQKRPDGVPADVRWVGDVVRSQTREAKPWQFTQKFALLDDRVVYSEQCISEAICLKLRPLGRVEKQ